ncbi:MAG: BrxA/BrxB family bacilliredoxin [Melioribacter sp.]|uniref:BrxA/BrxB family bacilliredoxin n=1 Tax=Rosettibacter primus TaxID=3111523 RepID=UPI00247E5081|nr:BrxA/BrxB family bacilliredoxin [Melioribacter sp.]
MFEINMKPPLYDPEAVQPMRDELIYVGFQETKTPQEVEDVLSQKNGETVFVVINSVCGCAAGSARPAVTLALQHNTIPDKFITVFAGMDRDAVDFLREKYLSQYPPSSPSMALFNNGELVYFLPRHKIEGRYAEEIAEELKNVFNKYCKRKGPSISPEKYAKLVHAIACGSKIQIDS